MHNSSCFIKDYNQLLMDSVGNNYQDNYDTRRFGRNGESKQTAQRLASGFVSQVLAKVGLARTRSLFPVLKRGISFVQPHETEVEWLYNKLADEESCNLLVQLFAYRALGHRHIKLPLN